MISHIPVLDFCEYENPGAKAAFGRRLVEVFCTTGFAYLKNHGVDQQVIDSAFASSKKFFTSPSEHKKKFLRPPGVEVNSGYVCQGMERLNAFVDAENEIKEVREAYNFLPYDLARIPPEFSASGFSGLFQASWELTQKIFHCLSLGLELQDADIFHRSHSRVGQRGNPTTLRTLWYPKVDFSANNGTAETDNVGGLEVENRNDEFVPATPISGCVLVNVADLLQRWTSHKLRSTRHRVGFGENVAIHVRQSMAFFVHPDDDFIITCLDGSDSYPPVSAGEYLQERFRQTY